jgi:thioredoxin 1
MKKILYFTATWCGPCKMMAPTISELVAEGCYITKIDVDSNPGLAAQYGVKSIPTFILVENDNEILRKVGPQSKEELKKLLN